MKWSQTIKLLRNSPEIKPAADVIPGPREFDRSDWIPAIRKRLARKRSNTRVSTPQLPRCFNCGVPYAPEDVHRVTWCKVCAHTASYECSNCGLVEDTLRRALPKHACCARGAVYLG